MHSPATDRAIRRIHQTAIAGAVTLAISTPAHAIGEGCEIPPDQPLVVNAIESNDPCDDQVTLVEAINHANATMGLDTISFDSSLAYTVIPANNIYVREGVTIQGHENASSITLQAIDNRIFDFGSSEPSQRDQYLLENLTLETETEITDPLIEFYGYGGELTLNNVQTTENTHSENLIYAIADYGNGSDLIINIKNSRFDNSSFSSKAILTGSSHENVGVKITITDTQFYNINAGTLIACEGYYDDGNAAITLNNTIIDGGHIGRGPYWRDALIKVNVEQRSTILIDNSTINNVNRYRPEIAKNYLRELIRSSGKEQSNLTINSSFIQGNTVDSITSNYSTYGSALTEILDSKISDNSLFVDGFSARGSYYDSSVDATITVLGSTIERNLMAYGGDLPEMLYTREGHLNVENSNISDNEFTALAGYVAKSVSILNSTISNNTSLHAPAGILILGAHNDGADVSIQNSTISGNSPNPDSDYNPERPFISNGSGIVLDTISENDRITANLSNVTITENRAPGYGGGILVNDDSDEGDSIIVNIDNSIIANNYDPDRTGIHTDGDLSGDFNISNSIIGDTSTAGHTSINGIKISEASNENGNNLLGIDAKLSPLQESAGMLVHLLQSDSPAIGAGSINLETISEYDQRGEGFPRVRETSNGKELDLGAVQFIEAPVAVNDTHTVEANSQANAINVVSNDAKSSYNLALDLGSLLILEYPQHGEAVANRDGTISYTPNTDFTGEDSLSYQVADVSGEYSSEATLTITVETQPTSESSDGPTSESSDGPTSESSDGPTSSDGGGPINPIWLTLLGLLGFRKKHSIRQKR